MAADTPRTLKLTTDGDLDVSTGNLQVLKGSDAIVQSIRTRLQFFKGEWFLDLNAGVPYFQEVLKKISNPNVLTAIFRQALLETPGVSELLSLALNFDHATRKLSVDFSAQTDVGLLEPTTVTVTV